MGFWAAAAALLLLYAIWSRVSAGRDLPLGARNILLLRGHYVLIALLLGPLIPETAMPFLRGAQDALLAMTTGWVGLALGIELDLRRLRRTSSRAVLADICQALFTFMAVYLFVRVLLPRLSEIPLCADLPSMETAVILGVAACTTSIWSHTVQREQEWSGPPADLLRRTGAYGGAAGIVVLAIIIAFTEPGRFAGGGWTRLSGGVGLGALMGILMDSWCRGRGDAHRIGYATVGVMAFGSGFCTALRFPPVFVGMVSGAWLVNSTLHRPEMLRMVQAIRPSVAGVFLVLIGLTAGQGIGPISGRLVVPVVLGCIALSLVRSTGKILGTNLAARLFAGEIARGRSTLGAGLLTQDAIVLAVLFEGLDMLSPSARCSIVLTVGLMTILMQSAGPYGARFALLRAGALSRPVSAGPRKESS